MTLPRIVVDDDAFNGATLGELISALAAVGAEIELDPIREQIIIRQRRRPTSHRVQRPPKFVRAVLRVSTPTERYDESE